MWWFRVAASILIAGLLAGCGFEPLYGRNSFGGPIVPQLNAITIAPANDRNGQLLRNELIDRLRLDGPADHPLYALQLQVQEVQAPIIVTRQETVTRYNMTLTATYFLQDLRSGKLVTSGQVTSLSAFNLLRADFANLIAEQDARARAARELSEQIRTRLALYFTRDTDKR